VTKIKTKKIKNITYNIIDSSWPILDLDIKLLLKKTTLIHIKLSNIKKRFIIAYQHNGAEHSTIPLQQSMLIVAGRF